MRRMTVMQHTMRRNVRERTPEMRPDPPVDDGKENLDPKVDWVRAFEVSFSNLIECAFMRRMHRSGAFWKRNRAGHGPRRASLCDQARVLRGRTSHHEPISRCYLRGVCACQESRLQDGQRAYDGLVRHCGKRSSPRRTARIEPFACARCESCPRAW